MDSAPPPPPQAANAPTAPGPVASAGYSEATAEDSVHGNRHWWDDNAADYLDEHGDFLSAGGSRFVWGPEGLDEAQAHLLGDVVGRRVLEVGSGAGQCTSWLRTQGALAVATDLSHRMLAAGSPADPRVQCDARRLPFADASFDLACSAYGALPFVADPQTVHAEVVRVLRPGGRWVFSVTHPVRWAFPDDPGPGGLTASRSYFDRAPYVERDAAGVVAYAEHHRTIGDRVREIVAAGLVLDDVVEPEWPAGHEQVWGGWSPLRGRLLPGTAVFVTRRP